MTIRSYIQRHQIGAYFVLAYGITWGGILAMLAAKGFRLDSFQVADVMLIFLAMLLGPCVSSLLLTITLDGRAGLRDLWAGLTRWRVGVLWWLIALLTIPTLLLTILSLLRIIVAPTYTPGFRLIGVIVGLIAGGCEEIGWTGFATPRLLKRHSPLVAGLILGLLWAMWHMLADLAGNIHAMGSAGWIHWFVIYWVLVLTAYRILMTWLYTKTRSLLVAQLMHASHTGWLFTLTPAAPISGMLWQTILAVSLWGLVAVVAIVEKNYGLPYVHHGILTRKESLHPGKDNLCAKNVQPADSRRT